MIKNWTFQKAGMTRLGFEMDDFFRMIIPVIPSNEHEQNNALLDHVEEMESMLRQSLSFLDFCTLTRI
jgi:hypothetical protein